MTDDDRPSTAPRDADWGNGGRVRRRTLVAGVSAASVAVAGCRGRSDRATGNDGSARTATPTRADDRGGRGRH